MRPPWSPSAKPTCRRPGCALPLDEHLIGHDIGRDAALDHTNVGSSLEIDATERHRRDRLTGDDDGVNAILRLAAACAVLP